MARLIRGRWLLLAGALFVAFVAGFPANAQFGGGFNAEPNAQANDNKTAPATKEKAATTKTDPTISTFGGNARGRTIPITYGVRVAMVMSPEKNRISAYSVTRGEWKSQTVEPAEDQKTVPRTLVSSDLVSLQTEGHVYAFSGETGQWDTLDVPRGTPVSVHMGEFVVSAEYGDTIALFSVKTGKWSALNWKTGDVPAK